MASAAPQREGDRENTRLIDASEWRQQRFGWLEGVRRDHALSPTARLVAHVLALDFAHHATLRCDPSLSEIARVIGVSSDTAKRAVGQLVAQGWLARECGLGRGRNSGYGFLTRAKIIALKTASGGRPGEGGKGGKNAPLKGGRNAPNSDTLKGGRFASKRGQKCLPPIIRHEPYKNHGARTGATGSEKPLPEALDQAADFWVEVIRTGRFVPSGAIGARVVARILERNLLDRADLRAVGVDC